MVTTPETVEDWLPCLGLPDYIAMTPSGHIVPIVGPEIWIDGTGVQMSRDAYIGKWGVDPKVVWKAVKEYRKSAGKSNETVML